MSLLLCQSLLCVRCAVIAHRQLAIKSAQSGAGTPCRYCHYVAGLVGIGLSDLWAASGLEGQEFAGEEVCKQLMKPHVSQQQAMMLGQTWYSSVRLFMCLNLATR